MNQEDIEAYVTQLDSEISLMLSYAVGENEINKILLQVLQKEYETLIYIINNATKEQMETKYYDYYGFIALFEFIKKFMGKSKKRNSKRFGLKNRPNASM